MGITMLTIKHLPALEGHTRKAVFNCALSDVMYHLGEASPRYPVPAIHRIIDIHPREIVMWKSCPQKVKDEQDYRTYLVEETY